MTAPSFWDSLAAYRRPAALRMLTLGFSSGLPLLLVLGTLAFWLRESGVDLRSIGFLSWVGLCWGLKWVWSPLVDSLPIPWLGQALGRRRSWLLLSQIGLVAGLLGMSCVDPAAGLSGMVGFAFLTAFCGATQDIALDAFRIESGSEEEQAAFAAMYQTGYRLAMIWAGAGALAIAAAAQDSAGGGWRVAYQVMAASQLVGAITVLLSPEPEPGARPRGPWGGLSRWLSEAVCQPFVDFFRRYRQWALLLLLLIATYRVSDVVMGVMANPFYSDLGFSKEEVAAVSKVFGVIMTLLGAFLGGVVALRVGVIRTMLAGAILSAATNLLFSALALIGHNLGFLVLTVSADNLAGGLASAAFVAYLSGLTNHAYSATQYALFSSVMLLLPKFLAGFSGWAVELIGYPWFFAATAALGAPVILLVLCAGRAREELIRKAGND